MIKRITIRLCWALGSLLVMSLFTFWLMHLTPGNYFDSLKMNPQISPETIARLEKLYGVHQPLLVQWWAWLTNIFRGEWGYSFYYNVPVSHLIGPRMGNTFILSLSSIIFTWAIAIPLGVWAALRYGTMVDKTLGIFSYMAFATPSFFLAMLLLYMVSQLGLLPLGGMHSANYDDLSAWGKAIDLAKHLIIPTLVLSLSSIGSLQRLMRANLLNVLRQPFITALRAKGLPEKKIVYVHALRNAFNPMVTLLGYEFASLLSGAALIEIICSWPGLGTLMLTAARSKDIYVVMASLMMGGMMLLVGNLLADIALMKLDPRINDDKN
jgi:peptide/nickel transport system permease protein